MKIWKLNLDVADARWTTDISDIAEVSEQVKDNVFSYVAEHSKLDFLPENKEINVNLRLSNDEEVHKLNRDFRGMDRPTNVLTFANLDYENFADESEIFGVVELGDIIIAYETMLREAEVENISLRSHYCHLLTHGLLHILGFDHIKEEDAEIMEGFEIQILANMGIKNPYEDFND